MPKVVLTLIQRLIFKQSRTSVQNALYSQKQTWSDILAHHLSLIILAQSTLQEHYKAIAIRRCIGHKIQARQ